MELGLDAPLPKERQEDLPPKEPRRTKTRNQDAADLKAAGDSSPATRPTHNGKARGS